jgi:hypothetical protein
MPYGKTDLGAAHAEYLKYGSANKWFKPQAGENYIRILPPWSDKLVVPWYKVALHWKCGPQGNRVIRCTYPSKCYVCEQIEVLRAAKNARCEALERGEVGIFNVLNLNCLSAGCQMWSAKGGAFGQIAALFVPGSKWGDVTNPKSGRNFTVEGTKRGRGLWYRVMPDPDITPIPEEAIGCLDNLHPLDTAYRLLTYEQQRHLYETGNYEFGDDSGDGDGGGFEDRGNKPESVVPEPQRPDPNQKLNCYGRFTAGDAFCEQCAQKAGCQVVASPAAVPSAKPVAAHPRCFGSYVDTDKNCKSCVAGDVVAKECAGETAKKTHT